MHVAMFLIASMVVTTSTTGEGGGTTVEQSSQEDSTGLVAFSLAGGAYYNVPLNGGERLVYTTLGFALTKPLTPAVSFIASLGVEMALEGGNWGPYAGAGIEFNLASWVVLDVSLSYDIDRYRVGEGVMANDHYGLVTIQPNFAALGRLTVGPYFTWYFPIAGDAPAMSVAPGLSVAAPF